MVEDVNQLGHLLLIGVVIGALLDSVRLIKGCFVPSLKRG